MIVAVSRLAIVGVVRVTYTPGRSFRLFNDRRTGRFRTTRGKALAAATSASASCSAPTTFGLGILSSKAEDKEDSQYNRQRGSLTHLLSPLLL